MLEIKLIDQKHQADIRLKNEPFSLWGKMLPSYNEGSWQYTICKFASEDIQTMRFPDENYCYDEMSRNSLFIGAYDDGKCIGLAIVQDAFFKYLHLYDLKVNTDYRKQGIGQLLIHQALKAALAKGYHGIYTQVRTTILLPVCSTCEQAFVSEVWIRKCTKEPIRKAKVTFCFIWMQRKRQAKNS